MTTGSPGDRGDPLRKPSKRRAGQRAASQGKGLSPGSGDRESSGDPPGSAPPRKAHLLPSESYMVVSVWQEGRGAPSACGSAAPRPRVPGVSRSLGEPGVTGAGTECRRPESGPTHTALRGRPKLASVTKGGKPGHASTSCAPGHDPGLHLLSFTTASWGRCYYPHFTDETPEPLVTRPSQGRARCNTGSRAPLPMLVTTLSPCPSRAELLSTCWALFQELDTAYGRRAQSHPVGAPSPVDEVRSAPARRTVRVGAGPGLEPAARVHQDSLPPCTATPRPATVLGGSGGWGGAGAERLEPWGRRTYLVELVEAECDSCHDDGQGTVISPSGTHGACGWEKRRLRRRGPRALAGGWGQQLQPQDTV